MRLNSTSGSLTFQNLALTTSGTPAAFQISSAAGIDVDGGNFTVNITTNGGPAVEATGLTTGTDLVFDTITVAGIPTKGINLDGTGS